MFLISTISHSFFIGERQNVKWSSSSTQLSSVFDLNGYKCFKSSLILPRSQHLETNFHKLYKPLQEGRWNGWNRTIPSLTFHMNLFWITLAFLTLLNYFKLLKITLILIKRSKYDFAHLVPFILSKSGEFHPYILSIYYIYYKIYYYIYTIYIYILYISILSYMNNFSSFIWHIVL